MSSGLEIKDIVDYLRSPPFDRHEGIVDFSKKTPIELLQVVNDVFGEVDDRQKKDIRDENKETMTARMLEFVTILGYKIEGDQVQFGDQFMRGNPSVIYPFLYWTLSNFDKNKTRGFLARYLRPFAIPEEHFADNSIVTMYQQYVTRQSEFKDVHIGLESVRKSASNPTQLQSEVTQLENEKEQLQNKLEKMRVKVSADSDFANVDFDAMLIVTNKLRQEQEGESKLYQDVVEQRAKLQRAEQIRLATGKKFQDMNHSDMGSMDPQRLLSKLRDEVQARKDYLAGTLENGIQEREKQLKQLAKIASSSSEYSPDDVHQLSREKHDIHADIESLLQRRENSAAANDGKITFVRDRLSNVEKKRDKLRDTITELEEEKKEAENDLKKILIEYRNVTAANSSATLLPNGDQRPQTDAQMKEYMGALSAKTVKYKALAGDLEHEREEVAILARTEDVLRSRDSDIQGFNVDEEKRLGLVGYQSTQDSIEAASSAKQQLDATKGETLEEITAIVERINGTLRKKKEKLAPQIKELRAVRSTFEGVEGVYRGKKSQYENVSLGYEADRLKLEQDVASHVTGIQEEESQYHFLNCFNTITKARLAQVAADIKSSSSAAASSDPRSYKTMYESAIASTEATTKSLRGDKKSITDRHDDHVAQRSMFQAMKALLNKKLQLAINPNGGGGSGGGVNGVSSNAQQLQQQQPYANSQPYHNTASYMDQLAEESDRLVLEQ